MFTHLDRIHDFLGVFCNLLLSFPISLYGLFNLTDDFFDLVILFKKPTLKSLILCMCMFH